MTSQVSAVTKVTQKRPENDWVTHVGDSEIAAEAMTLWRNAGEWSGHVPADYLEEATQNVRVRRVMEGFVSLGENCEFGFAQRAYGAEPLDLLRWASTPLRVVRALLQARFEGIDAPDVVKVRVGPSTWSTIPYINIVGTPSPELTRSQRKTFIGASACGYGALQRKCAMSWRRVAASSC
jgi:hypothetical protein